MQPLFETIHRPKPPWRKITKIVLLLLVVGGVSLLSIYWRVHTKYREQILTIDQVPAAYQTAVVFGAGLRAKGVPSDILADRVRTALLLYQEGNVQTVVLSGDNSQANHNEVLAMEKLATEEGLPATVLLRDHSGLSTLDTCRNLRDVFHLKSVILVTQGYHLRRALYDCNELGVEAVGVDAAIRTYIKQSRFSFREIPASIIDWIEVKIKH